MDQEARSGDVWLFYWLCPRPHGRLAGGGRRIRTRGPSAKGMAMGSHSRQALPFRTEPVGGSAFYHAVTDWQAQKSLSQERDRWFEPCSPQRGVCEPCPRTSTATRS